jgi:hypothetical protein
MQMLEAVNEINKRWGGCHIGLVEGYRNQWLISAELRDTGSESIFQVFRSFAAMSGRSKEMAKIEEETGGTLYWIRLGFCQTNITRAPDGGFTLKIEHDVLAKCRTVEHVIMYFRSMMGDADEQRWKREQWKEAVEQCEQDERLVESFAMVMRDKENVNVR